MSKNRRTHSKEFKAKVVLECLKENNTVEVLAKKYELLPTQISAWKSEAIKNMSIIFQEKPQIIQKRIKIFQMKYCMQESVSLP